ncbi:hypothetical protein KBC75_02385 [Candidatus Shapirobacteria bacterium]|nr:hypothetical protein [Candidatus Shapirobacteria bacterium]
MSEKNINKPKTFYVEKTNAQGVTQRHQLADLGLVYFVEEDIKRRQPKQS